MDFDQISLIKNDDKKRFEMLVKDHIAFIEYNMLNDNTINLWHTQVPEILEGQGVGKALIIKTFEFCRNNHLKMVATCPFISTFLKRHPEWQSVTE